MTEADFNVELGFTFQYEIIIFTCMKFRVDNICETTPASVTKLTLGFNFYLFFQLLHLQKFQYFTLEKITKKQRYFGKKQ